MSTLIEYDQITSRRMLLDLVEEHDHVVIVQDGSVIFETNRSQNPDAIFATLELVSDPHMREAILDGIDDLNHGREYTAEEAERILDNGNFR